MMTVERIMGLGITVGMPSPGRRRFGIPPGGAFDYVCFGRLLHAVGADGTAIGLELAAVASTFAFDGPTEAIFWGLEASIETGPARSRLPNGVVHPVPAGARIHLAALRSWARGWMVIGGGLLRVKEGHRLLSGDQFEISEAARPEAAFASASVIAHPRPAVLRVMPHPQGTKEFEAVSQEVYTVDHRSNRVGIRLFGDPHPHSQEQLSRPACMGLIQLPPEGCPIIFGPDGPTIGGYPQIGVVAGADIGVLAQLRPGDEVRFTAVSVEEAESLAG